MIDKKKIQKILYIFSFVNCCLIVIFIAISVSTDQWVVVRPIRKVPFQLSKPTINSNHASFNESLPIDLHGRKGCERFNGKIK